MIGSGCYWDSKLTQVPKKNPPPRHPGLPTSPHGWPKPPLQHGAHHPRATSSPGARHPDTVFRLTLPTPAFTSPWSSPPWRHILTSLSPAQRSDQAGHLSPRRYLPTCCLPPRGFLLARPLPPHHSIISHSPKERRPRPLLSVLLDRRGALRSPKERRPWPPLHAPEDGRARALPRRDRNGRRHPPQKMNRRRHAPPWGDGRGRRRPPW